MTIITKTEEIIFVFCVIFTANALFSFLTGIEVKVTSLLPCLMGLMGYLILVKTKRKA